VTRLPIALFVVVATASSAAAQPALPTCKEQAPTASASAEVKPRTYQEYWCDRVFEIAGLRRRTAGTGPQLGVRAEIENAVEVASGNWGAFLLYAQARSSKVDASAVEDARTDKQVGAPAGAGSTSLVSKGSVPGILGFAVENGALTQTTSSTTVTLRGNLVGWLDLLKNQDVILSYQDGSGFVRALRRVSYSLTLNTDTGESAAEPPPSGVAALTPAAIRAQLERTRQQLAGYSVRVAIVDRRDPRTAANRASIATLADTQGVQLLQADNAFGDFLRSAEYTRKWLPETADQLSDPTQPLSIAQIQRILYQRLEALRLLMINRIDGFDDAVASNLLALDAYDKARRRLFERIQQRPLFAFEYVNTQVNDLPDSSTMRFIAEGQWGSRVDLTANAAMTFQHSGSVPLPQPAEIGGRRDWQVAGQMDIPLGSLEKRVAAGTGIGAPVIGVAFLLKDLADRAAVSFAGNTFTVERGVIAAVQAKVMLSVKGSGVKIPLSLTYANRTELLKEKDVRGHVGVTFDMDVLSSVVRR
jgi:hypothetical protein